MKVQCLYTRTQIEKSHNYASFMYMYLDTNHTVKIQQQVVYVAYKYSKYAEIL